jgi:uncharacterized membrane protein HdeD (DUF308 family)
MNETLTQRWWAVAIRGVVAIVFAAAAIFLPIAALLGLTLLFAAYALVDGVFSIVAGIDPGDGRRHWLLVLGGIAGVIVGVTTLFVPGITALVLVLFIGWWALITGGFELVGAIAAGARMEHRWALALDGVLSIAMGLIIVLFPAIGAVTLVYVIAFYALVSGVSLIALAWQLRERKDKGLVSPTEPRSRGWRARA